MPKKGYSVITVRQSLYKQLNEIAEKENRSIASIVEQAVKRFIEEHE